MLQVEEFDYEVMELHRQRIGETSPIRRRAEMLKPYYRYSCKRPLFHDDYLPSLNRDNVTLVDCPAGIDRVTEHGRGRRRAGVRGRLHRLRHRLRGRGDAAPPPRRPRDRRPRRTDASPRSGPTVPPRLFGMMTSGFPNLFLMPCPGQQAVVTVNYTLLAEVGAEFVAATIAALDARRRRRVRRDRGSRGRLGAAGHDRTPWPSAPPPGGVPCTPGSRMLFDDDGNMVLLDPHAGTLRRRLRRLLRLPRPAHRVARARRLRRTHPRTPVRACTAGEPTGRPDELSTYVAGAADVVVTPVPALLSYCLIRAWSPTILPVIGLPPLRTFHLPSFTAT